MKRLAVLLTVLLVPVVLSGCSSGDGLAAQDQSMDAWIDPAIQGKEREIIREKMAELPESDRGDLVYVALDGTVYANKPELRDVTLYSPTVDPGVFVDSKGNKKAFPISNDPSIELQPQYIGTRRQDFYTGCPPLDGPYRRMLTKEGGKSGTYGIRERIAFIQATFGVKGKPYISIKRPDIETAYAFVGGNGIGANGTADSGSAVDAGLQYSPKYDNWALYLLHQNSPAVGNSLRWRANQRITVKLRVLRNNELTLTGRSQDDPDHPRTLMVSNRISDWPTGGFLNGRGLNLKQTVSIAQTGGYNSRTRSFFKGTTITGTRLGLNEANSWLLRDSDKAKICEWPNNRVVSYAGGAINIILPQ